MKKILIDVSKDMRTLIEQNATVITTSEENTYMHLPYWFKETDNINILEMITFDNLPEDLIVASDSISGSELIPGGFIKWEFEFMGINDDIHTHVVYAKDNISAMEMFVEKFPAVSSFGITNK